MTEKKKNSKKSSPEGDERKPRGEIRLVPIAKEMQKAYLDYAMSVIVDRALPEVGDGLKPSQRRILVAMNDLGLTPGSKYRKCAKIAGDTSGNYHPHGEGVVYPTLVRMGQDFNLRYPLIQGQGNFGSIDGDPPAAMRYTEARMAKFGELILRDLKKETVDYRSTYDSSREEPVILPSLFPNLICNGTTGIAVGMATNIPPHNLNEVVDALTFMIDKIKIVETDSDPEHRAQERGNTLLGQGPQKVEAAAPSPQAEGRAFQIDSDVTVENLTQFIKGPDFPTGGEIYNSKEITQAYATGKGKIVMRAVATIEENGEGDHQIVVSEIPYQVNKAKMVARIAQLVKDGKIEKIKDLRDESDRQGLRVVIELKRNARPQRVLNLLYKYTDMQKAFYANLVALVSGEPRVLTLKMLLEEFLRHRKQIVVNRTTYLLKRARHRAHILKGLKIALDQIDAVIETIKKSKNQEVAQANLIKKFELSEIQATAILNMQLRRLAALERQKIEDELKEVLKTIEGYETLLASPKKMMGVVKKEFVELKEKYGDARRTKVFKQMAGEFAEEELIESQEVIVTITRSGYIKRLPVTTYKRQGRGGKGVIGTDLKEEDLVEEILTANTHDTILFFTNEGKVYSLRVWDIPEGGRRSKGTAVVNLLDLGVGEKISAILSVAATHASPEKYLIMATRDGTVKRTALEEFENIRKTGLIAIKLRGGDELCWVKATDGKSETMLVTAGGKSIRFDENDARAMGRSTQGVQGIKLGKDDHVIGMEIVNRVETRLIASLLVVTENGYGKLTELKEYSKQKRGGSGILTARVNKKTGNLVCSRLMEDRKGDLLLISTEGQVIRLPVKDISTMGRATQGVRLMKLSKGNKVAALATLE